MEPATPISRPFRARAWTAVRLALGILLLATAGLKLAGRSVSAVPQVGWYATPMVQMATTEWELVLGLWLLLGKYRVGSWAAALVTFVTFAFVSGYLGWQGVASCGCFGAIHASPWYAFGLDLVVLAALVLVRPTAAERQVLRQEFRRIAWKGAAGLLLISGLMAGVLGAATVAYGSTAAALARLRGERVSVVPTIVDFGVGPPREMQEQTFELANRTNRPVRIVGTKMACSCKLGQPLPLDLPPSETVRVGLQLGFPDTPNGTWTQRIWLMTDDDLQPYVLVRCYGRVTRP